MWLTLFALAQAEEAVIVLPGLGDSAKGRRHMAAWGETMEGVEVLVPDILQRQGLSESVRAFDAWVEEAGLEDYERVHVFAYIAGTWTLNAWLQDKDLPNLASVVYDRSPLQERAPFLISRGIPRLARLKAGQLIFDLAETPYRPVDLGEEVAVGLLVENRATPRMRRWRKSSDSMGPVSWDPADLGQDADDLMFTPVNHDEMYTSFERIGPELAHFFEHGRFSDEAQRVASELDPWRKKI